MIRSGSDIVTRIPITKLIKATSQTLPLAAIEEPIFAPRGCIDISEPAVNRLIPKTRQTMPRRNTNIFSAETGVKLKDKSITINPIGNTDLTDSKILFLKSLTGRFLSKNYYTIIHYI
jgi:hypothetical protein